MPGVDRLRPAHLTPNTHVVLITRVDPSLKLARLRAAGALAEVRQADLAFTDAEGHQLLVVLGHLELGAAEIAMLVDRTEGWPAALVLAWLWLRTVDDPARAVRAFGGDQRFAADYLSISKPRRTERPAGTCSSPRARPSAPCCD
jgi:LuxR family maltose regulon positive regulatory protein